MAHHSRVVPLLAAGCTALLLGLPASSIHAMGSPVTRIVQIFPLAGSGVTGSAEFRYNLSNRLTTVLLTVRNLSPMTVHPVHIHAGSNCTANPPILYNVVPFHEMGMGMGLAADNSGTVRGRVTFAGSFVGKTWHINVHTGPGLGTMAQFRVLACGVLR